MFPLFSGVGSGEKRGEVDTEKWRIDTGTLNAHVLIEDETRKDAPGLESWVRARCYFNVAPAI